MAIPLALGFRPGVAAVAPARLEAPAGGMAGPGRARGKRSRAAERGSHGAAGRPPRVAGARGHPGLRRLRARAPVRRPLPAGRPPGRCAGRGGGRRLDRASGTSWAPSRAAGSRRSRLDLWADMLPMARRFPVFGVGFNAFATAYPHYQTIWRTEWIGEAHNDYLQVLLDLGLVGAALVAPLLALLFRRALARRRPLPARPRPPRQPPRPRRARPRGLQLADPRQRRHLRRPRRPRRARRRGA